MFSSNHFPFLICRFKINSTFHIRTMETVGALKHANVEALSPMWGHGGYTNTTVAKAKAAVRRLARLRNLPEEKDVGGQLAGNSLPKMAAPDRFKDDVKGPPLQDAKRAEGQLAVLDVGVARQHASVDLCDWRCGAVDVPHAATLAAWRAHGEELGEGGGDVDSEEEMA